jgi:FkbM family methyltransferase
MEALRARLDHYDTSQLDFQIAEIAGALSYLQHGVSIHPGATVLDVGANVGVAAAFFASECGAGAVHCFEPVPRLADLLRRNVAGLPACTVHEYGLSSRSRDAEITFYPWSAAMSGLYADADRDRAFAAAVLGNFGFSEEQASERVAARYEARKVACSLRTLSSVLASEAIAHVDLLKIDVERSELDVLEGIDESDWRRVEQVVLEVHDEHGRGAVAVEMLRAHGFTVQVDQDDAMRGTDVRMVYAIRS